MAYSTKQRARRALSNGTSHEKQKILQPIARGVYPPEPWPKWLGESLRAAAREMSGERRVRVLERVETSDRLDPSDPVEDQP